MIEDMMTVFWKEGKEILLQFRGLGGKVRLAIFVGILGVFMPLQIGRAWLESPMFSIYWTLIPLTFVTGVAADSFAGERERHTLETLLASRLSDKSILFGKLCATIAYGWGLTTAGLMLGLVSINLAYGQGHVVLYPLDVGLAIVTLSFSGAIVASALGTIISLRAATVRQAQQKLGIAMMLLVFAPAFGSQLLPEDWRMRLFGTLTSDASTSVMLLLGMLLIALDVALLSFIATRFKRTELVLD